MELERHWNASACLRQIAKVAILQRTFDLYAHKTTPYPTHRTLISVSRKYGDKFFCNDGAVPEAKEQAFSSAQA